MTNAANALAIATRMAFVADFTAAWAAGEFTKISAHDAYRIHGLDAETDIEIYEANGQLAATNPTNGTIEFADDEGDEWVLHLKTGQVERA
ncbi:MAG: hypothetical protein GY772_25565 [bacterium]|nr:hypothetical protein [bacterium]